MEKIFCCPALELFQRNSEAAWKKLQNATNTLFLGINYIFKKEMQTRVYVNKSYFCYQYPLIDHLFQNSGVVLRPGPHSAAPAAFFTSSLPEVEVEATGSSHRGHGGRNIPRQRKLKVNFKSDHLLWSALSRSELALVASIRQWEGNSGTLLSLSSGSQRYVKKT